MKALLHASVARNRKLIVDWVPAGDLEDATYNEVITNHSVLLHMLVDSFGFAFCNPDD